jgi:hypothetical protein
LVFKLDIRIIAEKDDTDIDVHLDSDDKEVLSINNIITLSSIFVYNKMQQEPHVMSVVFKGS